MTKSFFDLLDKTLFSTAVAVTLVLCSTVAVSAQTIISPSGATAVTAADEFATRELQDPWDMNERTDLGWWTFSNDQPLPNLSGMAFSGGEFSATPTTNDPSFWLLDPPITGRVQFGKDGQTYPIDASKYTRLMFRMSLATSASADGQVLWNVLSTLGATSGFTVRQGWHIYTVNIPSQTALGSWSGLIDSLRIDPTQNPSSGQFRIDWARLVDTTKSSQTITWSGGATYDIFISDTAGCGGNVAKIGVNQNTGSMTFYAAGLPPGNWYVGIATAGASAPTSCSSGYFQVSGVPTMSFNSPSEEGSSDDFATIQLSDAWDMNSTSDIDFHRWISGLGTTSIQAQTDAGANLGTINVLSGTSVPGDGSTGTASCPDGTFNVGDPHVYTLWSTARGATYRIDTSRYRILTWEQAIPRARDLCHGSVARVVWKVAGESTENVTSDIILRHLDPGASVAGALGNVMQKITLDLADRTTVPIDPGSPSQSGWVNGSSSNPGLDNFRIDFHEFSNATAFYLRRVKLAAFEKANDSYAINLAFTNPSGTTATVSFFRDTNQSGFDGTAIPECQNVTPSGSSVQCTWNTSGFSTGTTLYVYAQINVGGSVVNRAYARWPIQIDDNFGGDATLATDKSILRYTVVSGSYRTPSQDVIVTQADGDGPVDWTASIVGAHPEWFTVSPTSGSGTGTITVSIAPGQNPTTTEHTLQISSASIINSPRRVRLLTTRRSSSGLASPFGTVDTPSAGATGVTGSIGVTGWALDDIGVQHVQIFRNCLSIDNPASCQLVNNVNVVFIGTAAFLAGARPDVEAAYNTYPLAYRAGWGYLMLTNMLPHIPNGNPSGGGQGTMTIYAFATDYENRRFLLGQKSITLDNDNATRPFGAIDTPTQGGSVSGTFPNFGWALTPGTAMIALDGSTMNVVLDGSGIGKVAYDQCRAGSTNRPPVGTCQDDIATLFPNYTNIQNGSGAIGAFDIDTTTLSNGLHTIAWGVTDNQGRNDGIGSRFFFVLNGGSLVPELITDPEQVRALMDAPAVALRSASEIVGLPATDGDVFGRTGYDFDAPWELMSADWAGVRRVQLPEFGRLEMWVGAKVTTGYLSANGTLRALPPGSKLDTATGIFTWAPGPGYIGSYDLVFLQADAQMAVQVTIKEKKPETAGLMRGYIDGPATGTSVSRSFHIGGWALDLAAWQGSGVGAVHVWAQRRDAPSAPKFLGAAQVNVTRPDVAAQYGAQFDRAGWQLSASGLEPGIYDLTAYFWSTRTRQFEDARSVSITVR